MRATLMLLGFSLALTACSLVAVPETAAPPAPPTAIPPTLPPVELPTERPTPTPTSTQTEPPPPAPTETHTATAMPTSTPLPPGYVTVPDVIGMHYLEARSAVVSSGLTFAYRDIFDLSLPTGTVLAQDPPPGVGMPRGKIVFLYRTFQAPPALVGDICYPLRMLTTSGKLIFYVDLIEDVQYQIRTTFPHGETHISDVQMLLLSSFNNEKKDEILFTAPFTARYVISLGPYAITEDQLKQSGGAVDGGCLWVIPEEGG